MLLNARISTKVPLLFKLIALFAVPLTLFDGRIITRILLGSREVANVAYAAIFTSLVVLIIFALARTRLSASLGVAIALFCASLLRLWYGGVSMTIGVQLVIGYLALIAVLLYLNQGGGVKAILTLVGAGMAVNGIVLLEPSGILRSVVINNTAYSYLVRAELGYSSSDAANFSRAVGVYNSPGFLATYSALALGVFVTNTMRTPRPLHVVLATTAVIGGVLSGNRSFLVVLAVAALYIGYRALRETRFVAAAAGGMILIISLAFGLLRTEMINESVVLRLTPDALLEDAETRVSGGAGILPAVRILLRNGLIGAWNRDELADGSEAVQDEFETVRPHMSLIQIFASRGFIFGAVFVWLLLRGILGFQRGLNQLVENSQEKNDLRALRNGIFLAFIVCLSEPLLEFGPVLGVLAVGLSLADRPPLRHYARRN